MGSKMKLIPARVSVIRSLKVGEFAIFSGHAASNVGAAIWKVKANEPQKRGRGNKKGPIVKCDREFKQRIVYIFDPVIEQTIKATMVWRVK